MTETINQEERDAVLAIIDQEYQLECQRRGTDDTDWLPEWFLGRLKRIEAAEAELKQRVAELLNHCQSERKSLWYRWGEKFTEQVQRQILKQGGTKKSIKTLYGSAGYRTGRPSLEIVDKEAAKKWAVANLEPEQLLAAISGLNKTPLMEEVDFTERVDQVTGEVVRTASPPAGCVYHEERQQFYPAPPSLEQLAASDEKCLAKGDNQ